MFEFLNNYALWGFINRKIMSIKTKHFYLDYNI